MYADLDNTYTSQIPKFFLTFFLELSKCEYMSPCGANATCNYTEGSFICTCDTGFTGDGYMCNGMVLLKFSWARVLKYQFNKSNMFTLYMCKELL